MIKRLGRLCCIFFLLFVWACAGAEAHVYKTVPMESQAESVSVESGISGEAALEGYINQAFGIESAPSDPGLLSAAPLMQGSKLKGVDAKLYAKLSELIGQVAAGMRSSTEFEIPISSLIGKTSFSAAELGVEKVYDEVYNESERTIYLSITEQASQALYAKLDVNMRLVLSALMADLPYELYWYDKNVGVSYGRYPACRLSEDYGSLQFTSDSYKVSMFVAAEYSSAKTRGTTSFDAAVAQSVQKAAQNARDIVNTHRDKTDLEKLKAYRKAICDLAVYNYAAAQDSSQPYGNPWQMVWVFDGDKNTKVVCEGYAKAFKYLCDESTFNSYVSVALASGVSGSGGSSGRHMWNVVTMGDSRHYLVDVTNCDTSMVGYPDQLFMVGFSRAYTGQNGETGYVYVANGAEVAYVYDNNMYDLYSAEELAMSASAYEEMVIRAEWPVTVPVGSSWWPAFECWDAVEPFTWSMQVEHNGKVLAYYNQNTGVEEFTFTEAGEYDLICTLRDSLGRTATKTATAVATKAGPLRIESFTVETVRQNGENDHDVWLKLVYSGGYDTVSYHYQIFAKDSSDQWFMTWEEDSRLAEPHFWLGEDGEHYFTARITDGEQTLEATSEVIYVGHQPTPIEAFVTRCYKIILGRSPDTDGLKYWADALESGEKAASNIIDGFVNSQEFLNKHLSDAEAVEILYLTMLDRASDAGGKSGWVSVLSQGYPLGAVINGFCGSQEFMKLCSEYGIRPGSVYVAPLSKRAKIEAFVRRCYQIILSREPDAGGLNAWSNALESGAQAASNIIDGFVNSQEFYNKHLSNADAVEILYKAMLGRASDPAGKANWVNALNGGQPFAAVINGFCGSQEFRAICNEYGIQPGSVPMQGILLGGVPEDAPEEASDPEQETADGPTADAAETIESEGTVEMTPPVSEDAGTDASAPAPAESGTTVPEDTAEPPMEAHEDTAEPSMEAPEYTAEPPIVAPEDTAEPPMEAPEDTAEPSMEAPEDTVEPSTEAPEDTAEPSLEAPEDTTDPPAEAPEDIPDDTEELEAEEAPHPDGTALSEQNETPPAEPMPAGEQAPAETVEEETAEAQPEEPA